MTKEFRHHLNKGRIFYQSGAGEGQPKYKGKINIDDEILELSGWLNPDRSIDLRKETIEQAEAMRAKAKPKERRKKGRR